MTSKKLVEDTGGGCSVCGNLPVVNVSGTYWLCGPCVAERAEFEAIKKELRPGLFSEDDGAAVKASERRCQCDTFAVYGVHRGGCPAENGEVGQ